jgi:hypothetical protein
VKRTVHLRAAVDEIKNRLCGHCLRGYVRQAFCTISPGMRRTWRAAALVVAAVAAATLTGCSGSTGLFRQYEYEEEIYLSLDGTATVDVNASIPAINALRGSAFDTRPASRVDRDAVRAFYTSPVTNVRQVSQSRRSGRRFVHVRMDVDDISRLGEAPPFHWSSYSLRREGDLYVFRQSIGAAANRPVGDVGWNGSEAVAFRVHVPSKITYHNAGVGNYLRGNILVWEQSLVDRLHGKPLALDARMQTRSILYRTIILFGLTLLLVAATFAFVIVAVLRGGKNKAGQAGQAG